MFRQQVFTRRRIKQLSPMYEQIFEHAPTDPSGATAWLTSCVPSSMSCWRSGSRRAYRQLCLHFCEHGPCLRGGRASNRHHARGRSAWRAQRPDHSGWLDRYWNRSSDIFYCQGAIRSPGWRRGADNYVVGGSFDHLTSTIRIQAVRAARRQPRYTAPHKPAFRPMSRPRATASI